MYEKVQIQFNAGTHLCKTVTVSKQICRNIVKKKNQKSVMPTSRCVIYLFPIAGTATRPVE
jgi:hypothetical protein